MKKDFKLISNISLILLLTVAVVVSSYIPAFASSYVETKSIKDIPIGSIVYDPNWEWEFKTGENYTGNGEVKPIEWIVVDNNYKHFPKESITLLSKELVALYPFDNRNSNHINKRDKPNMGYSFWGSSNKIRPFLNTTFYNSFGDDFKKKVINTEVKSYEAKDYETYKGLHEDLFVNKTDDKVFIPSAVELGLEGTTEYQGFEFNFTNVYANSHLWHWSIYDKLEYFRYNSKEKNNVKPINDYSIDSRGLYSTRSLYNLTGIRVMNVDRSGKFEVNNSWGFPANNSGIRPILNINEDTTVKKVGEKWEIIYAEPGENFIFDERWGEIKGYIGKSKNLIIPSEINGSKVKTIAYAAFRDKGLTHVFIPDSVTNLEEDVFSKNELTSIDIPDSIKYISGSAFAKNKLTSVKLPNTITNIGNFAFANNQLTSIDIPDNVTKINRFAFWDNKLESLSIPDSVTHIEENAFADNNIRTLRIPETTAKIDKKAFNRNNSSLIIIPANIQLGEGVFSEDFFGHDNTFNEVYLANNSNAGFYYKRGSNWGLLDIFIKEYNKDWINKDLKVEAELPYGKLSKDSHTFTENGSYIFEGVDNFDNSYSKEVVITNIDKVPPKLNITVKD